MSSCCHTPEPETDSCCGGSKRSIDWLLWGSLTVCVAAWLTHFLAHDAVMGVAFLGHFSHGIFELLNQMWWGILFGITALTLLAKIPKEFVTSLLGRGGGLTGILRATFAGLLLDLCNHGILMVGAKLYERGATLGQTFAFLVASPWNSLSTTLILIALIGWQWTLVVILLSGVVAILAGCATDALVRAGKVASNPNTVELPEGFRFWPEAKKGLAGLSFSWKGIGSALRLGLSESRMVLRWIFFGAVLAAAIRGLVPPETYENWFGPTLAGLGLTLVAATIIEVCSEGSSPVAADLFNRAGAPGNGFSFLMAGAATDYTEIMILRSATGSLGRALLLPVVTVPQILVLGWMLNQLG